MVRSNRSPYIEDDIAQDFSALAEFMCQCDLAQRQASSHRMDQPVASRDVSEVPIPDEVQRSIHSIDQQFRSVLDVLAHQSGGLLQLWGNKLSEQLIRPNPIPYILA